MPHDPHILSCFLPSGPGLEPWLCAEVQAMGLDPVVEDGGVAVSVAPERLAHVVAHTRLASRVLVRVGERNWRDSASIATLLAGLPWMWWPDRGPVDVRWAVHGVRSEQAAWLRHEIDRQIGPYHGTGEEPLALLFRVEGARLQISADAAGRAMHLRGWRTEQGEAPLRETIAAGLLRAAGYPGQGVLWDPMTGSGTIALEAATWGQPALWRPWAIDTWRIPGAEPVRASPISSDVASAIVAGDLDPEMIALAQRNADRAGVADRVTWVSAEVGGQWQDRPAPAFVVCNPPWGHRLGRRNEVRRLFERLGAVLQRDAIGARAAILAPEPQLARELPLVGGAVSALDCGGLTLWLATGTVSARRLPVAQRRRR